MSHIGSWCLTGTFCVNGFMYFLFFPICFSKHILHRNLWNFLQFPLNSAVFGCSWEFLQDAGTVSCENTEDIQNILKRSILTQQPNTEELILWPDLSHCWPIHMYVALKYDVAYNWVRKLWPPLVDKQADHKTLFLICAECIHLLWQTWHHYGFKNLS